MPFLSLGIGTAYSYAVTAPAPVPENPAPPKWIAPWLAVLAPLYVVSPLSLLALPYLKKLPKPALYVLGFYALSQQIPALFTPDPLLASAIALVRTLLMFGLIGVGVALGDSQRLRPLLLGLTVVYVTSLLFSYAQGLDIFTGRLSHPYMTSTTLALSGALGVYVAVSLRMSGAIRVSAGLMGLAVLLLSGSRGALLSLVVGLAIGAVATKAKKYLASGILVALCIGGIYLLLQKFNLNVLNRVVSIDTTGRDLIWYNTMTVIKAHPWFGVGDYLLGRQLGPSDLCSYLSATEKLSASCNAWSAALGNPWLIAHNLVLQQLAESGPVGLFGLLILLSAILLAAGSYADLACISILAGLLVLNLGDNTIIPPSPFFAEVFWIVSGIALARGHTASPNLALVASPLLLLFSLPMLASLNSTRSQQEPTPQILFASFPRVLETPYEAYFKLAMVDGSYRAALLNCKASCHTVDEVLFHVSNGTSEIISLHGNALPRNESQMTLLILPKSSTARLKPVAQYSWTVTSP